MLSSKLKTCFLILLSTSFIGQSDSADDSKKLEIPESAFKCLAELTASGAFFVDNLLGNLDATLAVANSDEGGKYPAGSLVTLVPNEVMIKHLEGWNPGTNDWEFFLLDVSAEGSKIAARGTEEVGNRAGSCYGCHQLARPQWDLVCGVDHGCAALPFTSEQIRGVQNSDPRCTTEN
jgi:hypothetical protein